MNRVSGNQAPHPTLVHPEEGKPWISHNWPLVITACFALVWIFHRAFVQSLTLDEAITWIYGSPQESDQVPILSGLLENHEFGLSGGHALGFE